MPERPDQLVSLDAQEQPHGCKETLFGRDSASLAEMMTGLGEPAWRGAQIAEAIYRQHIKEISEITTLPGALRERLIAEGRRVGRPQIVRTFRSEDGTERYLVECTGNGALTVETVWMPEGDGEEAGDGEPEAEKDWRRATICVSSQVGCAVNCRFCLTAKLGLQRNLTAGEIAGQVVAVLDRHGVQVGRDRVNLVFMGMGEPFLNYDNFMAAVRLLVHEMGLSPHRMTVSTSGIVPGIERFALEPADVRPRLAISLNAPNDRIRADVMPINRKWPIAQVIDAVKRLALRPRERVTFEYVLLGGVTDRAQDAHELAALIRSTGLAAKVNLIAWNPGPGIEYTMPAPESVETFQRILRGEGIAAFIRQPRGRDIFAACGQLKRTEAEAANEHNQLRTA
jgi:23S rRNA (adenine2503-C2)-methyltransferase